MLILSCAGVSSFTETNQNLELPMIPGLPGEFVD
jgi:hypothetical protein